MFEKKCSKCKKEIKRSFEFCPYCGNSTKKIEDWGMLGKNDIFENDKLNAPRGNSLLGFTDKFLEKMLSSTMKIMEKELNKSLPKEDIPLPNFELFINGKKIDPSKIKITKKQIPVQENTTKKIHSKLFSAEQKEKYSQIKKQEPKTNLRRLSDRIIYELELPGIKNLEDISIKQVDNSIEIQAIAPKKAYFKVLEIGYTLLEYRLQKEKLILEFEVKE